ncbi:vacuolar protein sorting-associated protein [Klebsormidium nitens]|uniref:Vacuolar protein sorting-associated protein n=1 Tax=Klebsormidium nitens TaxID=105231 RepID=A0A1Y1HXM8_KLENI|nr:vacuolar protein sorting-associated protein [Klebsormidium nitens]|eukprot:GAQ83414.1 vacuolar protein sorting-associated protein [Klebsormidium nitens]
MASLFTKKKTPKELVRESKREMQHAGRGLDREVAALQLEEKKLVAEIKKTAATGNKAATKVLARQLIRLRGQVTKLQSSKAQLRGVQTHTQAMVANSAVAGAMKGATDVMTSMNKLMDPAQQRKTIMEFQKQNAQMDMAGEMVSDSIDDALDGDDLEEETDDLTNQVLDEIGVDTAAQLASAPKTRIKGPAVAQEEDSFDVDDLDKRLAALRAAN